MENPERQQVPTGNSPEYNSQENKDSGGLEYLAELLVAAYLEEKKYGKTN